MTIKVDTAVFIAVTGSVVILFGIIVSLTVISLKGIMLQPAVVTLFTLIASAFVASIATLLSHTLGFANGTVNGENAAQAAAIRSVMKTDTTDHSGS